MRFATRLPGLILPLLLATFLAAASLPAHAQTVADIEVAWRGWMTMNGRGAGGLAVMHQGRLAHQAVMGGEATSNAVPLASLSAMAQAFYAENRRVANGRAKRLLGWRPAYPDYRVGLGALNAMTSPASANSAPATATTDQR